MKVEQVICDECKRQKGEGNHWMKIGVLKNEIPNPPEMDSRAPRATTTQLTLGVVPTKDMPGYEVHDICGQSCFHKHIDNLLGLSGDKSAAPPPLAAVIEEEAWRDPKLEYTGV